MTLKKKILKKTEYPVNMPRIYSQDFMSFIFTGFHRFSIHNAPRSVSNSNDVEALTYFRSFFAHFGAIIVKQMMKFAFNLCCLIHRVFIIIKRKIKNQHWTVGQSTQYGC